MNRSFAIIRPANRESVVVAPGLARSRACIRSLTWLRMTCLVATGVGLLGLSSLEALANSGLVDPVVKQGSVSVHFNQAAGAVVRQTSNKAVIDWRGFSLDKGERLEFVQPGRDAITLNRVTGPQVSSLQGELHANGQVWLLNPNGVLIGKTGRINTHGFLATTMALSNENFAQGNYSFKDSQGATGSLLNQGQIISGAGGYAVLAGGRVRNEGLIQAQLGQVVLASGSAATMDLVGDGLLKFVIDAPVNGEAKVGGAFIENASSGQLVAPGGRVLLTAQAATDMVSQVINVQGLVQATSVRTANGEIVIEGGSAGTVAVSGKLDVSGVEPGETGGAIKVFGQSLDLQDGSVLNASGHSGGGEIYVGGGWQGALVDGRASAVRLRIDAGASLDASALGIGNGGTIVAWSDIQNPQSQTHAYGSFKARGGEKGGDGGQIETSGYLINTAGVQIDTGASEGRIGNWLLDPSTLVLFNPSTDGYMDGTLIIPPSTLQTGQVIAADPYSFVDANDLTNSLQTSAITLMADDIFITHGVMVSVLPGQSLQLKSTGTSSTNGVFSVSCTNCPLQQLNATPSFVKDESQWGSLTQAYSPVPHFFVDGQLIIDQQGNSSLLADIVGQGDFIKRGSGTLSVKMLPFTTTTKLEAGSIKLGESEPNGSAIGDIKVLNGTLDLNGFDLSANRTLYLQGTSTNGPLTNSSSTLKSSFKGQIILESDARITSGMGGLELGGVTGIDLAAPTPVTLKPNTVNTLLMASPSVSGQDIVFLQACNDPSCSDPIFDVVVTQVSSVDATNGEVTLSENLPSIFNTAPYIGLSSSYAASRSFTLGTRSDVAALTFPLFEIAGNARVGSFTTEDGVNLKMTPSSSGIANEILTTGDQTYGGELFVNNSGAYESLTAPNLSSSPERLMLNSINPLGSTISFKAALHGSGGTPGKGLLFVSPFPGFQGGGDILTSPVLGTVKFYGDVGATSSLSGIFVAAQTIGFDKVNGVGPLKVAASGPGTGYSSIGFVSSNQSIQVGSTGLDIEANSGDIFIRGLVKPLVSGNAPMLSLKTDQNLYVSGEIGVATSPLGAVSLLATDLQTLDASSASCDFLSPLGCPAINVHTSGTLITNATNIYGAFTQVSATAAVSSPTAASPNADTTLTDTSTATLLPKPTADTSSLDPQTATAATELSNDLGVSLETVVDLLNEGVSLTTIEVLSSLSSSGDLKQTLDSVTDEALKATKTATAVTTPVAAPLVPDTQVTTTVTAVAAPAPVEPVATAPVAAAPTAVTEAPEPGTPPPTQEPQPLQAEPQPQPQPTAAADAGPGPTTGSQAPAVAPTPEAAPAAAPVAPPPPEAVVIAPPPPPPPPVAPPPPSPVPTAKPPTPVDTADAGDKTLASVAPPEPPKPAEQPQRTPVKTVAVVPGGVVNVQVPVPPRPPATSGLTQKLPSVGNSARW